MASSNPGKEAISGGAFTAIGSGGDLSAPSLPGTISALLSIPSSLCITRGYVSRYVVCDGTYIIEKNRIDENDIKALDDNGCNECYVIPNLDYHYISILVLVMVYIYI